MRNLGERRAIARIVASRITGTMSVKPDCWPIPPQSADKNKSKSESWRTTLDQILSTTAFLSSFSAYSDRMSNSAIRVPLSGFTKSLVSGPRIRFVYSSDEKGFSKLQNQRNDRGGRSAPIHEWLTREGRMWKVTNSVGKEDADPLSVLRS